MRKAQKAQAEELAMLLEQAHDEIREAVDAGRNSMAAELLAQCQEGAIRLGELIEKTEGEGFSTIALLERYCELVYQVHEELTGGAAVNANHVYKKLRKALIQIQNSIRSDIRVRLEMAFLPYKASMWDSLESVWMAADADPDCDAYVVPIPYYDKNNDGSLGTYHYEGSELPADVPVVPYDTYDLEQRRPDVIYIHNPYDNSNFVTTVDPRFYSAELKKYTDLLVYIPYYSTTGGMSEGQASCPAYYNADYIVIQAAKYRRFFDGRIPDDKFLVMGSPKFDRVIRLCENPPEPPADWKEKMQMQGRKRKKVYFYNTSIGGMLSNTEQFLKKMAYVFKCFKGREDACLLWRPHPLMASTFDSLRPQYRPRYEELKRQFIEEDWGIFDETPDIESTIALCDAYIGDSATSVTSLFGVAGKPLFILNNAIDSEPEEDDWRGEVINPVFDRWGKDRYWLTLNNQLWFSEKNDYHYRFYMDLETGYAGGSYYMKAIEVNNKIYVLPCNARNLLVIEDKKIRKIEFQFEIMQSGAFFGYWRSEKYIFLFPFRYPLLVRFDLETEEIRYIDGIRQFNVRNVNGEWRTGGICAYGNELVFASPEESRFLFMDMDTMQARAVDCSSKSNLGTQGMVPDGEDLWLLPLNGMVLTCWNPKTGAVREYGDLPVDFKCVKWPHELECEERPFGNMAISREGGEEHIVISPSWGNMYLTLDRESGKLTQWQPPVLFASRGKNGYFPLSGMGGFVITIPQRGKADCRIWYAPERKLYNINIDTKEYSETEIVFDCEELKEHASGFGEESEWMQYCLKEDALHSLKDVLGGNITGKPFDGDRQTAAFSKVSANTDGTCGAEIYQFVRKRL